MPSAVDTMNDPTRALIHAGLLVAKPAGIPSSAAKQGAAGASPMKPTLLPLKRVRGPDGAPLMLCDLPPAHTTRWVARRKAEVVCAVRGGLLSVEDACRRYVMTIEEYRAWEHAFERFGVSGLRSGPARHDENVEIVSGASNS